MVICVLWACDFKILFLLLVYVCVYVYARMRLHTQDMQLDPPGAGVTEAVVSYPTWVLGTKFNGSGKATSFNY